MSFFKRSIDNIENVEIPEIKSNALDYNEVLNYLVVLPDDEYEKLLKVANIYRRAERQVADVLQPEAATTELNQAKAALPTEQPSSDEVADEINAMLKDYIPTKTEATQK